MIAVDTAMAAMRWCALKEPTAIEARLPLERRNGLEGILQADWFTVSDSKRDE
jgi:hypothetical protein